MSDFVPTTLISHTVDLLYVSVVVGCGVFLEQTTRLSSSSWLMSVSRDSLSSFLTNSELAFVVLSFFEQVVTRSSRVVDLGTRIGFCFLMLSSRQIDNLNMCVLLSLGIK